jgi:hypothetical protein
MEIVFGRFPNPFNFENSQLDPSASYGVQLLDGPISLKLSMVHYTRAVIAQSV